MQRLRGEGGGMSEQIYINCTADARKCIGQKVYWDDVSSRYIFLRHGILEEVFRGQVSIDGDFRRIKDRPGLRNFEFGGAWQKNKEAA